jgi:hypothetical protein
VFTMFGAHGVTGVNLYSLFVAVIGAVLILVLYHAVRGGRARAYSCRNAGKLVPRVLDSTRT